MSLFKQKFYSKKNIDKTGAEYRIIFGERANGKTFSVLHDFIEDYLEYGWQGAYIRRWTEDVRPKTMRDLFTNFELNEVKGNIIEKLSGGRWNSVKYQGRDFYLIQRDEDGEIIKEDMTSFCHAFSISDWDPLTERTISMEFLLSVE